MGFDFSGVEAADPDLKNSLVTVKGVFDPSKLVEYVYKRTGKHAVIVKQEPEKKEEKGKEEKGAGEEKDKGGDGGEKKEGEGETKAAGGAEEEETKMEMKKNEFQYYFYPQYYQPPKYAMEYVYPPQIFSDENPNACSVM
ncbi:hypothetical protein NE237_008216 [Protea cynaroides]|uniref:Uncharacterized protein n=1 Tax=Protea cynaroides TaxID=273540 RepID=A0A9Q0QX59_9MAGN|nr:hypothetical protein NE237_008216 [Protea cynaroides]